MRAGTADPIVDDDFLVIFNAGHDDVDFHMPAIAGRALAALIDTREASGVAPRRALRQRGELSVDRSLAGRSDPHGGLQP